MAKNYPLKWQIEYLIYKRNFTAFKMQLRSRIHLNDGTIQT